MSSLSVQHLKKNTNTGPQWQVIWHQFTRHRLALASLVVVVLMVVVAFGAEILAPYDPTDIDARNTSATRGRPSAPTAENWLGKDDFNRDILSRNIYGLRVSLLVGISTMVLSTLIGVLVGALSGFFGGWLDAILMRFVDTLLNIPLFALFLALNLFLPAGVWSVVILISLFSWPELARLVRAEFLALKEQEFIVGARAIGAPNYRLILAHILPNALSPIIVAATLAVPAAILTESTLSFLGLGVPLETPSLGKLINDSQQWLRLSTWWMWLPPGIIITLLVLCFNFLGDGLRDALDPTLHQ
jgi:peptide/nickel transport system permease protein